MNKNFMIEELCMEDLLHANPLGAEVHYADQNVALLNNLRNFSNRAIRMSAELSMLLFCREGKVDFTALFQKLHELGYDSWVTIEREIEGDEQLSDILKARDYLQSLIDSIY